MIQVKGTLNGETFKEDTPIGVTALANAFGIKLPAKNDPKQIKVLGGKDDKFGQHLAPASVSVPTTMQIYHPGSGESIQVSLKRPGDRIAQSRLKLRGENHAFDVKNAEEYLYLALHPLCEQSPVRDRYKRPLYKVYDTSKIAQDTYDAFLRRADVQNEIFTAPFASIWARAFGINVGGMRAEYDPKSEVPTRVSLIKMLEKDPSGFIKQWYSDQTKYEGVIRAGILNGYVDQRAVDGQNSWVWSSSGDLIVKIKNDADPFRLLIAHADAHPEIYTRIESLMATTISAPASKGPVPPPSESATSVSFNSYAAQALRLGVVVSQGGALYFQGEEICGAGAGDAAVALNEILNNNSALLDAVKAAVKEAKKK